MKRAFIPILWALASATLPRVTFLVAADLKPETLAAFNQYVAKAESRMAKQVSDPSVFLYVNTLPAGQRDQAYSSLRAGDIYMTPLATPNASSGDASVPDGMVHHWLGTVFIPGTRLGDVLRVVQDYDHKQDVYPEVVRSHLVSRDGEHFRATMRFREHHVITITLDTEHDVNYTEVDPTHWYSRSYSTRVSQVENAGKPDERDLPDGQGDGFLWRIDTYWRFVERDHGVYLEVEAISLSRAIPAGLGWLITPFLTSVPRESLQDTLGYTRSAVLSKLKPAK
jgi:hypothetical protein